MASLRKNFLYSTVLTMAGYVFPLLVYPYISRVLGVEKVGLVGFVNSLTDYFILFSMMGISVVGVREVAYHRGDEAALRRVFWNLLALNGILTGVALAGMGVATLCVDQLRANADLMLIGMGKLFFNMFLIEWLYQGLEKFRYITWRFVLIRSLYVISVFIFVRNREDYATYFLLTLGVVALTAIVNMSHGLRYVGRPGRLNLRRYLRPFMGIGVFVFLMASYGTMNVAILGFMTDDTEVGYYTTATKLFAIILSLYNAAAGVMMPRMSALVAENKMDEFRLYARRSLLTTAAVAVPIMLLGEIFADEIVLLISGPGYEGAVTPVRIMMPVILLSGFDRQWMMQVLMPLGRHRAIVVISLICTGVALLMNLLLIPRYGAVGAAWAWLATEGVLCGGACLAVRRLRHLGISFV